MIQARLFQDQTDEDRWESIIPPYRPPRIVGSRVRRPLACQLLLPGMGEDGVGGAASVCDVHGPTSLLRGTTATAVCPNCGGTEFDEDGDCSRCLEPGVVRPSR